MDMNKKSCLNNNIPNAKCDRISNLPDAVVQHVLSFLNIKHAVQTCVLSRRWKNIWKDVLSLNFKFDAFPRVTANFTLERRNAFVNFMHQVLNRRCNSEIHKFSFEGEAAIDASRLRSFVDHALQCNVQTLELTYSNMALPYRTGRDKRYVAPFEMPNLMFTSKSLRVLKLSAHNKGSINLPRTLSFITLKKLSLHSMSLWDNTTDRELISDCPNLEYLALVSCDFGELQSLKITAPQLTNLEILFRLDSHLVPSPGKCIVIVSAPKLSCFKYFYHRPLVCSIGNPLDINTVDIDIWKLYKKKRSEEYNEQLARQLIAMLQEFQHAKSVTLSLTAIKILSKVPGVLDHHSSPFCNLKNFRLNAGKSSFSRGLSYILQNSSRAKTTQLRSSLWFDLKDATKW